MPPPAAIVLNAFRHHRGGHIGIVGKPPDALCVLNAFRHHRGGHGTDARGSPGEKWCSTPFGITEVGMDGLLGFGHEVRSVLNAFRHHRGGHGVRSGSGLG